MMAKVVKEISMYGRSLLEAERTLATHKDVVVPVKEVWLEVSRLGQLQRFEVPPLIHFSALLEADERFEFITAGEELGDEYVEPAFEEDQEYPTDIERLSFYSEDRVRLRNIEASEELTEELNEEPEEPAVQKTSDEEMSAPPKELKAGKTGKSSKLLTTKNKKQKAVSRLSSKVSRKASKGRRITKKKGKAR